MESTVEYVTIEAAEIINICLTFIMEYEVVKKQLAQCW